ncbi:MAG: cyclase family protein [Alphaproteobacteria bacterium]|nr:MAG: cyclase family protein [Alphaproteobacteria bacterium]
MCHACVIDSVKRAMISRRDLFRGAVAGTAAAAAGIAGTTSAFAATPSKVVDLTYGYDESFPTYFGAPGISSDQRFNFAEHGFNLKVLTVNEHTGTHLDAPLHFSADGASVDQIAVENLVLPLCIVDIREKAAANADAELTPDDLKAWISANGPIPDGACVAMNSGWQDRVSGDGFRNADSDGVMHFPGFHIEATQMLLETNAAAIGVDTLSLDYGKSGDFKTHYAWLPAGRYGIENLKSLDQLPASGATLVVGAPTHKGGTGGPARVLALL